MPKSSSNNIELDPLLEIKREIHQGRDSHGRILPGSTLPRTRYRPEAPCEGPDCDKIVPAGLVMPQKKHHFCSPRCDQRFQYHRYVIGECEYCDGEVRATKYRIGVTRHCCREHEQLHLADVLFFPTGCFRSRIETYLATTGRYKANTLSAVKVSLIHFFSHVYTIEGVTNINDITSAMVSRFGAAERNRGMTAGNYMGHLSTFFKSLMAEDETFTARNPVIPYIHSQKSKPGVARPYTDKDLESIWDLVKASDRSMLMLAFVIGEECGMRIGEVGNIRLQDIDQDKQTIFVRLPTKNMDVRTVPYHDKVATHLRIWLQQRNPACKHDRLLHSHFLAFHNTGTLNTQFRKLFEKEQAPALGFSFHRLRHTWATRLMNNGMELAVLKELGGWKSWNSMQRYIRVLPDTIRGQYEAAYRKLQEQPNAETVETLSLMDFAALAAPSGAASTPLAA